MNKQKTEKKYLSSHLSQNSHNNLRGERGVTAITAINHQINDCNTHQKSLRDQHIRIEQQIERKPATRKPINPEKQREGISKINQYFKNDYYQKLQQKSNKSKEHKFNSISSLTSQQTDKIHTHGESSAANSKEKEQGRDRTHFNNWNSSVNIKDSERIKILNNKIIDLTNENNRIKVENQQLVDKYKESLRVCQFLKRINDESTLGMKRMSQDISSRSHDSDMEILMRREAEIRQEQLEAKKELENRVEKMEKQMEEYENMNQFLKKENSRIHAENLELREENLSLDKVNGDANNKIKSQEGMEELLKKMQSQNYQKFIALNAKISHLEQKCMKNQFLVEKIIHERSIKISNAFKKSNQVHEVLKPILGDIEEPNEHLDESGFFIRKQSDQKQEIEEDHNFKGKQKVINDDRQQINKLKQKIRNKDFEIQTLNGKVNNDRQQNPGKNLVEGMKRIRDDLVNCNTSNFDLFIAEFTSLVNERRHILCKLQQIYDFEDKKSTKAWKLQRQLNESRAKYRQLVNKYIKLQNYIIEKSQEVTGSHQSQQNQSSEQKLLEEIFDSRIRQEKEGQVFNVCSCQVSEEVEDEEYGQEAIKWNLHVREVMERSIEELSSLIEQMNDRS